MRIISGKYGGRKFPDKVPSRTRPTSDKVRESIFNILCNLIDFNGQRVLDLYAGTGALGIEALSRGAEYCTSVDINGQSISFIKKFSDDLKLGDSIRIIKKDALSYLQSSEEKYDLVFADPPYALLQANKLLERLLVDEILNPGGLFVIEHSTMEAIELNNKWKIIRSKNFGQTAYEILELQAII